MNTEFFQNAINDIPGTIKYQSDILQTTLKQRFMIVMNKVLIYAVRILIEIDDRYYIHIYSHKLEEFLLKSSAVDKCEEIHRCLRDEFPPNFEKLGLDVTKGVFFVVPEVSILKLGDHIQILRNGIYSHAAIYIGEKKVIHISGTQKKDSQVKEDTLSNFESIGGVIFIFSTFLRCRSPETIVKEAKERIGFYKGEYNLLWKNCQHLATECQTGIKFITDINKLDLNNLKTFCQTLGNSFKESISMTPFTNSCVKENALLHHPNLVTHWHFNLRLLFE